MLFITGDLKDDKLSNNGKGTVERQREFQEKWNAMQNFDTKTQWLPPSVALKICLNFAHRVYLWVLYE
jgi:hypothetical protein